MRPGVRRRELRNLELPVPKALSKQNTMMWSNVQRLLHRPFTRTVSQIVRDQPLPWPQHVRTPRAPRLGRARRRGTAVFSLESPQRGQRREITGLHFYEALLLWRRRVERAGPAAGAALSREERSAERLLFVVERGVLGAGLSAISEPLLL